MTVAEILEQAQALSPQERKELVKLLVDTLDVPQQTPATAEGKPKTGAEIVAMLEAMDAHIELVDAHIEDPVEWVKAQRRKREEQLRPYWDGEA